MTWTDYRPAKAGGCDRGAFLCDWPRCMCAREKPAEGVVLHEVDHAPAPKEKQETAELRSELAKCVGNVLDHWEGVPNDLKDAIRDAGAGFEQAMDALEDAQAALPSANVASDTAKLLLDMKVEIMRCIFGAPFDKDRFKAFLERMLAIDGSSASKGQERGTPYDDPLFVAVDAAHEKDERQRMHDQGVREGMHPPVPPKHKPVA